MMDVASSSSFQPKSPRKYDVFVSFRGEDTRTGFTSHLHAALIDNSIETFIDNRLERGGEISPSLVQAIKGSSVSIVVFSQDYASSKWCLDELAQIFQYRKDEGQFVIPIFYKVDPSDVRKQKGTYKKAFKKHKKHFKDDQDKVNKWKAVLFKAANLSGWHCQTFTDESDLIRNIVDDVVKKLDHMYPNTLKDAVGNNGNIKPSEELLEKFPKVGIWGMGGIGKTTMAKAIFAKLASRYQCCCFMENVREDSEKYGLKHVRNTLVSELLMEESMRRNQSTVIRDAFVTRRLGCKEAFIVLDDVDSLEQLENLSNVCDCLGAGSKVIITTRNRHLLQGKVDKIHDAKPLSHDSSLEFFIRKAFGSNDNPEVGYEPLINGFIEYTQGIPLALRILGSNLFSEPKEVWESALKNLKTAPDKGIQQVLQWSYDGLDRKEKEIFLDITCFLKGENEEFVKELLNSDKFDATPGIKKLLNKALVEIRGGRVWMHHLIQEMGLEIVRLEDIKNPSKRSRLWDSGETYDVLKNDEGGDLSNVEGIMLDISQIGGLHLTDNPFKKMTKLRFLKFYWPVISYSCNVHFQTGLDLISSKIRYFRWDGYPEKSMPSKFCAKHLFELELRFSKVETLWKRKQDFVSLRRLNLSYCYDLRKLPNFSKARNLESVNLTFCRSLRCVPPSLLSLHSLISLILGCCESLKRLKSKTHLKSLKELDVHGCSSLKEFSVSSEELMSLNLLAIEIEILSPSIGRCGKLKTLKLDGSKLKNLPIAKLGRLRSLEDLWIQNHTIDNAGLRMLLGDLAQIRKLKFRNCCQITKLPKNIKQLSRLEELDLRGCSNLQCLQELPPSLDFLCVADCTSLSLINGFSMSIGHLSNLKCLFLNASSLGNLPLTEFCGFRFLAVLCIRNCSQEVEEAKLNVVFDALPFLHMLYLEEWPNLTQLPDNIRHLSMLQCLSVEGCTGLRSLPKLPPSIRYLIAKNCTSLETVPTSTISSALEKYDNKIISFVNCVKLGLRSLGAIEKESKLLFEQGMHNIENVRLYYPGKKVPKWFGNNRTQMDSVIIELTLTSDNLLGFVFCTVVPEFISEEECERFILCYYGNKEDEMIGSVIFHPSEAEFSPGHVLLCCHPQFSERIVGIIEDSRGNHGATTDNRKFFFKFYLKEGDHYQLCEESGVFPVYASEYRNVDGQGNSELKLRTKKRTRIIPLSRYLFLSYYHHNKKRRRLHI